MGRNSFKIYLFHFLDLELDIHFFLFYRLSIAFDIMTIQVFVLTSYIRTIIKMRRAVVLTNYNCFLLRLLYLFLIDKLNLLLFFFFITLLLICC